MIPHFKYRRILAAFGVIVLFVAIFLMVRPTPQSEFKDLFATLSVATPGYLKLFEVRHPSFTIKGDYCTLDFSQSSDQLHKFIAQIGASEDGILSSSGVWVKVDSKIDPKYPWTLLVRADSTQRIR